VPPDHATVSWYTAAVTRRLRRALLLALPAALVALAGLAAWVAVGLPARTQIAALKSGNPGKTRLMLQREQEARARGRRVRAQQVFVPLGSVSRHLIHAVLASEDQSFFGHEGVDWKAVQESLEKDVVERRFARGGSTITQQLAKNLYFGTQKTPVRKLRELLVAHWLEQELSKPRILELYLNVIEWGDFVYGCEAAAERWCGKPAADLTEQEAAGLAAMIPNPRRLNPVNAPARHARATRRVLWLMARAGYLGKDAAPLGAEPPAEVVPEDEEAESVLEAAPPPEQGAAPAPEPVATASPDSGPTRSDAVPDATPTPTPRGKVPEAATARES
jgi:monofunctional biosynthetic peptidoglycan transglycosylase